MEMSYLPDDGYNMAEYIKLSYKPHGMKMNRHGNYVEDVRNSHPRAAFKKGLVTGGLCRSVWYKPQPYGPG